MVTRLLTLNYILYRVIVPMWLCTINTVHTFQYFISLCHITLFVRARRTMYYNNILTSLTRLYAITEIQLIQIVALIIILYIMLYCSTAGRRRGIFRC